MNSSIAIVLTLLLGTVMNASTYFHANLPHSLSSFQQDTTLSDYQLRLEEKYFAIDAILEEGVETEHVADSIKPYVKGLTMEFRERIYKEHKRLALHTTGGAGSLGIVLFLPVVSSIIQGDRVGIGLGLAGIGSLVAITAIPSTTSSSSIRSTLGVLGFGCLIATAIRAASFNDANKEFNKALSEALLLPMNLSYSVYPDVRSLHDGTIVPTLTFRLRLD